MSKQATAKITVTAKLFSMFDACANAASLTVDMARTAATDYGLNTTSAEIAFYNWRMQRGFYKKGTPALSR